MLRRSLALVAGLVLGMAIVFLVEGLGGIVFPAPPGMDPYNPDTVRDRMSLVSVGALLFVLAAWALGALSGSYVAGRLIGLGGALWAGVVGALVMAGCIAKMTQFPHPAWFVVASPLAVMGATVLGTWLSRPRKR